MASSELGKLSSALLLSVKIGRKVKNGVNEIKDFVF